MPDDTIHAQLGEIKGLLNRVVDDLDSYRLRTDGAIDTLRDRVNKLENWQWKSIGMMTVVALAATILGPLVLEWLHAGR